MANPEDGNDAITPLVNPQLPAAETDITAQPPEPRSP